MNKKVLYTLEFDKIRTHLEAKATSESGKSFVRRLRPMTDIGRIRGALQNSADAFGRIIKKGSLSFTGLFDVSEFEKRLAIGASLSAKELLSVHSLLIITDRAKVYGRPDREDAPSDSLSAYFSDLTALPALAKEISRCILSEDEIADDASSELASIRRSIAKMNGRVHDKLSSMLSSAPISDCLQDHIVVQRDNRYCLPVRAEYKSRIPGLVHDSSASGSTLFIEPMAVLELGNELRELEHRETEEIERILQSLSMRVGEEISVLIRNYRILAELDFIFAKGELASELNGSIPVYNNKGIISLRGARHPLLDPKTVVPVDITLGSDYTQLVITGPNTGGKTVTLKTAGLLALMGQSGLLIPAKDRSALPVFTEIYADIGDEQSIEQSLSTFSSHLTNIVRILRSVDRDPAHTFVLFDELCAGTDPAEGAALATAILDRLRQKKVRAMATTHYSELKAYALSQESVENASCEFNVETLTPTYRLLIGIPGKSNAFAISQKLGLSSEIIEDAKNRLSEDALSFEDLLVDLENKRHQIEEDREAIRRDREHIAADRQKIASQREKLNTQRADIIAKANEKASNILRDAKNSADAAIRNINKYGNTNPDIAKMEASRRNLGKKLTHTQNASQVKKQSSGSSTPAVDPKKLKVGDRIHVNSLNLDGTVHTLPNDKGELMVTMGIMQSKVNIRDIMLLAEADPYKSGGRKKSSPTSGKFSKSASISAEIKLLGMTTDEALIALDKYLDDARLSHLGSVRVVHGKGTGALRKAVHEYLRKQPVSDYHLAEYGEGDTGVTIVDL
ncbi:MAG: endonuclease MutS2 [Lachnospiraceae bacterium]|nr:endonuclease MutS2 [Lachnospiraceae bacterium]